MSIERVQKGSTGNAIRATLRLKPGRIHGTGIATDDVVSATSRVIGVVYPELSVIENVKNFETKLNLARLRDLKVLQHCHVDVHAHRIILEVSPSTAGGHAASCHKL